MQSSFCASFPEHHRAGAGGDGRCWLRLPIRHHCHGNAAVVSGGSRAATGAPNACIAPPSSSSEASDQGKPPIRKEGCSRHRVLPPHTRTFGCSPHGSPSRLHGVAKLAASPGSHHFPWETLCHVKREKGTLFW